MVMRWRMFMQSFMVWIRHIPGAQNKVADWMTRLEKYYETNCMSGKEFNEEEVMYAMLASIMADEEDLEQ